MTLDEVHSQYRGLVKKAAYAYFRNEEKAEDACQDYFLWLHLNLNTYNQELSSFKTWFINNMRFSFQNTKKRTTMTGTNLKPLDNAFYPESLEDLIVWCKDNNSEDLRELFNKAAKKLSAKEVILLQQCIIEGKTFSALSQEWGVTLEAIRQNYNKTVKKFKRLIAKDNR